MTDFNPLLGGETKWRILTPYALLLEREWEYITTMFFCFSTIHERQKASEISPNVGIMQIIKVIRSFMTKVYNICIIYLLVITLSQLKATNYWVTNRLDSKF